MPITEKLEECLMNTLAERSRLAGEELYRMEDESGIALNPNQARKAAACMAATQRIHNALVITRRASVPRQQR